MPITTQALDELAALFGEYDELIDEVKDREGAANWLADEVEMFSVRLNGVSREFPVTIENGVPAFVEPVFVGVRLGKGGTKLWKARLHIGRNARFQKMGADMARIAGVEEFVTFAYSPLNSINRDFVAVAVAMFWDLVPEAQRSRR
jgi:hypothetical protein